MTEPLERIQKAVDAERVRYDLTDALMDLKLDDLRELVDAAEALIAAADEACAEIETWHDAEAGEDRAEARDDALEALQEVLDKAEDLSVWLEWPNAAEAAQEARMAAEVGEAKAVSNAAAEKLGRHRANLDYIAIAAEDELAALRTQFDPRSDDREERELGIAVRARCLEVWGEPDECFEIISEPGAHPTIIELAARKRLEELE